MIGFMCFMKKKIETDVNNKRNNHNDSEYQRARAKGIVIVTESETRLLEKIQIVVRFDNCTRQLLEK